MSLSYVIKEGFAGFKRARLSAFSSITAITLAVVLLAVLARVSYNAYTIAQSIKQDVEVEVFLQDIDESRTQSLRNSFTGNPIVDQVTYVSKEDAMEQFKEEFGPGSEILGSVNFLPASFRIRTKPDVKAVDIVAFVDEISTYRGVEEVKFNQRGLELLEERLNLFIIGGVLLGLLIGLTALILVFNTIRLTIYAKRDLIVAMKLVGATNGFVKRPFMIEGLLQGVIAAIISTGIIWLVFHLLIPSYVPQVGVISWPYGRWYYLVGTMVFTALFMGFAGSRWASKKFINQS